MVAFSVLGDSESNTKYFLVLYDHKHFSLTSLFYILYLVAIATVQGTPAFCLSFFLMAICATSHTYMRGGNYSHFFFILMGAKTFDTFWVTV